MQSVHINQHKPFCSYIVKFVKHRYISMDHMHHISKGG